MTPAVALGLITSAVLALLSGLHVYWGLGGVWPGSDPRSLALTVAGFKGVSSMPPPLACFAVATALGLGALWVQGLSTSLLFFAPRWLVVLGGGAIAFIFLVRGAAAYATVWRQMTPEQPFAAYDVALYGPLCLVLGAAICVLTVARMGAR